LEPDGTLLWKGYLQNHSQYQPIKNEVHQDLPFLGKDENRILYGEDLVPQISSILSSAGVGAGLVVKPEASGIVINGDVPPEKKTQLHEALAKISSLYPDVHLDNKAGTSSGGTEIETILGGRVAGITFGKSAWIELSNGIRLFPGSRLANGMTLRSISETEIIFQTPNGMMKMPVETITAQPAPLQR
jgi:type III secretion system YscD/HrpQ family protein